MSPLKECNRCVILKVPYRRLYEPVEFLEGYTDSPIWVVGLNPAEKPEWQDERTVETLQTTFDKNWLNKPYFKNLKHVSPWLYSQLGKPRGVAHTDLVKCSSEHWPPPGCSDQKAINSVVENCAPFLRKQIEKLRPQLIICNGAEVSRFIQREIPVRDTNPSGRDTSYPGSISGYDVWVVLSGFMGRNMDKYSRIRLGQEIEGVAEKIGLKKPANSTKST